MGVCSSLGVAPDYVLYEMTWQNALMYGYAQPNYDDEWDESIDANNVRNEFKEGVVKNPFI